VQRVALTVGAVLVLGAGVWFGGKTRDATGIHPGSLAPDFAGATLADPSQLKGIAAYRGEVVVINLWATWCVPCVTEMPSIQRLYERFAVRGLKVVGIAVDDPPFADRVADFVKERGVTFEILHEGSGKVEQDYGARGIPATYIVARDGRIRVIRQGAADWDAPAVHAVIEQLLAAPRPAP
jgi:cytochrome c biogenesis protein CcmG, thiol:disulfide interchange protein DsbE